MRRAAAAPQKRVIILGGGIAGMTAAHELIEREFDVIVYEARSVPGGKARSVSFPGTARGDREDLPGEHGFRFFPNYYRHVPDTMKRIPNGYGRVVHDHLVDTTEVRLVSKAANKLCWPARFPRSRTELRTLVNFVETLARVVPENETAVFKARVWQILTSCQERRTEEYERIGWWHFISAANMSEAYQKLMAHGLSRSLVAAKAEKCSTKTLGNSKVQTLLATAFPGISSDRVLDGPTNSVWINPWLEYLRTLGVRYEYNHRCRAIHIVDGVVRHVSIENLKTGVVSEANADYYIAAVPVEVMAGLLTVEAMRADPRLEGVRALAAEHTAWMNGIQFYLRGPVDIAHGHAVYLDSPWALTSICQAQFWKDVDLSRYGDGNVRDILSVDVSDWTAAGTLHGRPAKECTPQQVMEEVWQQLKDGLNASGAELLTDSQRHSWFLDPDLHSAAPTHLNRPIRDLCQAGLFNDSPLLVNEVHTWDLRPEAYTGIRNLFLAGDYVRTNTDLATMEGANEAARRAVNGVLDVSGSSSQKCRIWPVYSRAFFSPSQWRDRRRYAKGLPWRGTFPPFLDWLARVAGALV